MKELQETIEKSKQSKKRPAPDSSDVPPTKQRLMTHFSNDINSNHTVSSKSVVEDCLVKWIVDGMQPFSEIERPSFIKLWSSLSRQKLMCRTTLMKRIDDSFHQMTGEMMNNFESIDHLCITADCWTIHNRSYLGITCHWIDGSLERKNATLACRRIKGKHTYDVLAKEVSDVLIKYRIQNKIVLAITDSGSNFLKAFRVFGNDGEDEEEVDDDLEIVSLEDIFESYDPSDVVGDTPSLPPHRCACHTLNLVATKDIEEAFNTDPTFKKMSRSVFANCQSLWNKSRQSSKAADVIREHLGCGLVTPNATRWNSTHSAVTWLYKFLGENDNRLHQVCDKLGLPRLKGPDKEFLREYNDVMEPLSKALDILQGDKNVSISYLLPTLHRLLHFIKKIIESPLKHCKSLARSVQVGIERRFGNDLWNKDLVVAACLHPRFKLAWIDSADKRAEAMAWVQELLVDNYPEVEVSNVPQKSMKMKGVRTSLISSQMK